MDNELIYTIRIKETMQRDVRIKATSEDDALEKAAELYYAQEIILDDNDLLDEENDRFDCVSSDDNLGDCEYSCDDEDEYYDEESRGR